MVNLQGDKIMMPKILGQVMSQEEALAMTGIPRQTHNQYRKRIIQNLFQQLEREIKMKFQKIGQQHQERHHRSDQIGYENIENPPLRIKKRNMHPLFLQKRTAQKKKQV